MGYVSARVTDSKLVPSHGLMIKSSGITWHVQWALIVSSNCCKSLRVIVYWDYFEFVCWCMSLTRHDLRHTTLLRIKATYPRECICCNHSCQVAATHS